MILPIYAYGNNVLRKVSEEIEKGYPDLEQLINDMFETMKNADGVGLAAPQIGKNIRIVVIDGNSMSEDYPEMKDFRMTLINPIIEEEYGDDLTFREACLSLPRVSDEITRPSKITLTYFDTDWNLHEEEFSGVKARVIQHECDHLDGKLWTDRLPQIKRKLIQSKLTKISKGQVFHNYPMKFHKM